MVNILKTKKLHLKKEKRMKLIFITSAILGVISLLLANEAGKLIEAGKIFSFHAPKEFVEEKVQGIDSFVGRYKSDSIQLSFDYGKFSNALGNNEKKPEFNEREVTVDGLKAKIISYKDDSIKGFSYFTGIHFPLVNKNNLLTMTANCKDQSDLKIANAIFISICFKREVLEKTIKLFGEEKNYTTIKNAEKITVFRIEINTQNDGKSTEKILSTTSIPKEKIPNITKLLSDENSYAWPSPNKKCEPKPGVLIVFEKGDQKVSARFCFECQIVLFGEVKQTQADFDPINKKLITLMKEIFPKDEVIQKL